MFCSYRGIVIQITSIYLSRGDDDSEFLERDRYVGNLCRFYEYNVYVIRYNVLGSYYSS